MTEQRLVLTWEDALTDARRIINAQTIENLEFQQSYASKATVATGAVAVGLVTAAVGLNFLTDNFEGTDIVEHTSEVAVVDTAREVADVTIAASVSFGLVGAVAGVWAIGSYTMRKKIQQDQERLESKLEKAAYRQAVNAQQQSIVDAVFSVERR